MTFSNVFSYALLEGDRMLQNEKVKLLRIELSSGMDRLSREEREKAVSFGVALNAVEGVVATEESASVIAAWCSGSISYLTAFETILKRYGFLT